MAVRVKDMEDKVTVLDTKTEAYSRELGKLIDSSEKNLKKLIEDLEKKQSKMGGDILEGIGTNRKVFIYLMIPVLIILVLLIVNVFAPFN
ncbi:MAG: hypothetical protein ABJI69_01090 [Balneola sp.]